jgi:hypothetical protein
VYVESRTSKYESMQLLLTVVLGFAHVALYALMFYVFLAMGPLFTLFGFVVGGLEIAVTSKMSDTLAVLRFWLLAAGAITMAFSASCLLYVVSFLG